MTAAEAAAELGCLCSLAAVTDGANGSCLSTLGRLQVRFFSLPEHFHRVWIVALTVFK